MAAVSTSVHVFNVLIHYLHCCTELKFAVQQLSLNILHIFNPQVQGYNIVINFIRIGVEVFEIYSKTNEGVFFLNTVYMDLFYCCAFDTGGSF